MDIINLEHSFIKFGVADTETHCVFGTIAMYLPVYADTDLAYEFVVQGTSSEIDALCTLDGSEIDMELVNDCGDMSSLTGTIAPQFQRVRLGDTQVLYMWSGTLTGWPGNISSGECFRIRVTVSSSYGSLVSCSNILQRITDPCFTSVIEYGNDEDAFGFKYCQGGEIATAGDVSCEPTNITFFNQATLDLPYTAQLQAKYGAIPTVQAWLYDPMGNLINMGITITFDNVPPTNIHFDMGGPASGLVIIR